MPPVQIIVAEGDSVDGTPTKLYEWRAADERVTVTHCNTGLPRYGNVVNEERFSILSQVFNAALAKVDVKIARMCCFCPTTSITTPTCWNGCWRTMSICSLRWCGAIGTVRHISMTRGYFRRMGSGNFYNFSQAWAAAEPGQCADRNGESVGGTVLMRSTVVAAGCRYRAHDVDRGLCAMARDYGFGVWCDPTTHVRHGA